MSSPLSTKTASKMSLNDSQVRDALRGLIRDLGYDPDLISVDDLQTIADKLSHLAQKDSPWGWRYLRNVLNKKIEPSSKLASAILALGATIDGMPVTLATSHSVQIQTSGNIRSGSIVFGDSQPCANPACPIHFVPRVWNQSSCSPACAKVVRKLKRGKA